MEIGAYILDGDEVCALSAHLKNKKWVIKEAEEKDHVVAVLPTSGLFVREVKLAIDKIGSARKALPFQLDGLFPKSLDAYVIAPVFEKVDGVYRVVVHACEKQRLDEELEKYREKGINPLHITSAPQALFQYFLNLKQKISDSILLDLSSDSTSLLYVKNRRLRACVSIDMGHKHLKKDESRENYQTKLKRSLYFLENRFGEVKYVIYTGLFSKLSDNISFVEGKMVLKAEDRDKALLLGACIDAASSRSVQLQPQITSDSRYKKQIKKSIAVVFAAVALLWGISIYGWNHLKSKLSDQITQIAPSEFQSEIAQVSSIDDKIESFQNYLIRLQKDKRYYVRPPLVTELLDWLTTSKVFREYKPALNHFEYNLTAYPSLGNTAQSSTVQITIGLSLDDTAREELKELLAFDRIEDLEWEENDQDVTASFTYKAR